MTRQRANVLVVALLAALAAQAADEPDPEPPMPYPKTRPADRTQSNLNLRQIGLAFHAYHDAMGAMPGPAITDNKGKALLSWRVAVLPFVEEDKLYKEFRLDEPWDSAHNKKLLAKMPKIYAPTITGKPDRPNATYYQVLTGPDTPFNPANTRPGPWPLGLRLLTFTDGTSNTLMAVEAKDPVPWTKPEEIVYDAKKKLPAVGGLFPEGFHAVMADGSVKFFARKFDEKTFRAAVTPMGGEVMDWSKMPVVKREEKK